AIQTQRAIRRGILAKSAGSEIQCLLCQPEARSIDLPPVWVTAKPPNSSSTRLARRFPSNYEREIYLDAMCPICIAMAREGDASGGDPPESDIPGSSDPPPESWLVAGPRNITGVIRAVAVHPTDPNQILAGSERGGVWRTFDGG